MRFMASSATQIAQQHHAQDEIMVSMFAVLSEELHICHAQFLHSQKQPKYWQ